MGRYAAFAAALFLLFRTGMDCRAGTDKQLAPSELIEQLPSLLASEPPPPEVTEAEVIELEENDPETYTFIRGAKAHPPKPVRLGGDGRLTLTRRDFGETVTSAYRNKNGTYNRKELEKLSRLMRCSLTGRETAVSLKLIEIMDDIEDHFGKTGLTLLSGYRTPTLNGQLPGAARRSLHMLGWAADIRVPAHSPDQVSEYAQKVRSGGVGYYPDAAFVHLDAGRPRHWLVRRSPAPPSSGQKPRHD